jgi:hypothetical protein
MKRIGKLRTTLAESSNVVPASKNVVSRGSTRPNITEDGIIQGHRRENLKPYNVPSSLILLPLMMEVILSP